MIRRLDKQLTVWLCLPRHFGRTVISAVLLLVGCVILIEGVAKQREHGIARGADTVPAVPKNDENTVEREQRIARKVETLTDFVRAGHVHFKDSRLSEIWIEGSILKLHGKTLSAEMVSEFGSLTNLKVLALKDTQVTDVELQHLKGLTNLRQLSLNHSQITDAGLQNIEGMSKLKCLFLDNTKVTDVGLEHLKGMVTLERITLRKTQVTDSGMDSLKELTRLEYLILENTRVTSKGRSLLQNALPQCAIDPEI